jgi:hypothetical protein
MLPDFSIPVLGFEGDAVAFVAWDVPAWLYLYEMPDVLPGAQCWERSASAEQARIAGAWESWATDVLTRVILEPPLTRELVARLGRHRDSLLLAYQRAIGWLPEDDDAPPVEVSSGRQSLGRQARLQPYLRPRTWVPGPNVQSLITLLSAKTRLDPWSLQCRPISEWIWLYRVCAQEALTKKRQRVPSEYEAIGTMP